MAKIIPFPTELRQLAVAIDRKEAWDQWTSNFPNNNNVKPLEHPSFPCIFVPAIFADGFDSFDFPCVDEASSFTFAQWQYLLGKQMIVQVNRDVKEGELITVKDIGPLE